jgi:hypothetical protein
VSDPPARSDDNPFEEAFTFRLCFHPGIIGESQVDLAPRRRGQRSKGYGRPPSQRLVGCGLCPFLKLMSPSLFKALAVKVHGKMVGEAPVKDSVAEILKGIEAPAPGSCEKTEICPLELSLECFHTILETCRDLQLARTERLRKKEPEHGYGINSGLDCDLISLSRHDVVVKLFEPGAERATRHAQGFIEALSAKGLPPTHDFAPFPFFFVPPPRFLSPTM